MEIHPMETIETLREKLRKLTAILESGEDLNAVLAAQKSFSSAVDEAMKKYNEGKIEVKVKGLPADMHLFATKDLPKLIEDESQWPNILKDLKRFERVMELVVEPKEEG